MAFNKNKKDNNKKKELCQLLVKPLLGLLRQPVVSFGMLTQVNVVVIFIVAHNFNAVIHKVIIWQLDDLLSPEKEKKKLGSAISMHSE